MIGGTWLLVVLKDILDYESDTRFLAPNFSARISHYMLLKLYRLFESPYVDFPL